MLNATGNTLNNAIAGNSGNNIISGGGGIDLLSGNAGADRFVFNLADTTGLSATTTITDLNFAEGDSLTLNGFAPVTSDIHSYLDLARLGGQGVTVTAGATPGSEQFTLTGANGHSQVIVINDTSGNGTAVQQYQAAVASLAALGTGLPVDTHLTYVARFVDANGNVIASDGNNGWLSLDSFGLHLNGLYHAFVRRRHGRSIAFVVLCAWHHGRPGGGSLPDRWRQPAIGRSVFVCRGVDHRPPN